MQNVKSSWFQHKIYNPLRCFKVWKSPILCWFSRSEKCPIFYSARSEKIRLARYPWYMYPNRLQWYFPCISVFWCSKMSNQMIIYGFWYTQNGVCYVLYWESPFFTIFRSELSLISMIYVSESFAMIFSMYLSILVL